MNPLGHSLFWRVANSAVFRAMSKMIGATSIGQLAILASLPLVTRLYDPHAFGLHALLAAFVAVASVGSCLSLELAIVQAPSDQVADHLCAAAILSSALTAILSALLVAALVFGKLLGYGELQWWSIPLTAVMVCLNGVYVASRYRQLREQRYGLLARTSLSQSLGRALAPLGWFLIFPTWLGLTLGELSGRALGVKTLVLPLWSQLHATHVWRDWRVWWSTVCRERRYTVVLLSVVLIDAGASALIAPLLASSFGANVAGEYFLVATLLVAPAALLGTAAADVLHTRGALLNRTAPEQLPTFVHRAAVLLLLAGTVIYLPVFFFAADVIPMFFGKKWLLAAPIAQAMTPYMIVAFAAGPCSRLLIVLERTELKVISDVVRLVGVPIVIVGTTATKVPFEVAIWVLTWFLTIAYSIYLVITLFAVHQNFSKILR